MSHEVWVFRFRALWLMWGIGGRISVMVPRRGHGGCLGWPKEPRCGSIESSESVLVSGDEIEQSEALLFRRLVESDEGFLDAVDEVVGVV